MMKFCAVGLIFALLGSTLASAIPTHDEDPAHKRTFDKELSDTDHFDEGQEHNFDYDHEAFLGREEARTFDDLSPEESKEKLGLIYEKIDFDKDGLVSEHELQEWIQKVQNRYTMEDTNRQWEDQELAKEDNSLSWEAYRKHTYGYLEDEEDYAEMLERDKRRWSKADSDADDKLTKEEFSHFLHPEDAPHMRDIVIDETVEDIDKNGDGQISLEEYIEDMWPASDADEEEPDWVRTERDQFATFRDINKDGVMDRKEVEEWILPPDYDHTEAEARHLVYESDMDGDKLLSKEEVLDKYDLFVGSQATDFGEALTRHDEF